MNTINNFPAFHQVLSIVTCFTLLSGGGAVAYSMKDSLSPQQARVAEICNTSWTIGFGAIVGLLGSKAIDKPPSDEDEEEK
ncbi:hypothetical protein H6F67_10535 [Microcoleus sp. FACHB-1515]|uniref:hypothetical protein n=1 Tax=Cyanophyceae TaxID=3028117 RepID=UPI001688BFBA|nr:hypothetical protein [Microcoleus sp. FACHB-1515]MBD2090289.1 hypothetical protein [Microcoleus sp. FACHB-1515]